MARATNLDKKIAALVEHFKPQIRQAYLTSIQGIKDRVILQKVIDAIEAGNAIRAFEVLGFSPAAMRPLTAMIEQAFEEGGIATAASIPRNAIPSGNFLFDVRNSRAEKWSRDMSSRLVTQIGEEQRKSVQQVIEAGMKAGANPRTTALDLVGRVDTATGRRQGGIVGLSGPQQKAVTRARIELKNLDENYFTRQRRNKRYDGIVARAIKTGNPLSADDVTKIVNGYSNSLLQLRGETIARSESIEALNSSQFAAYDQAAGEGVIGRQQITKVWDSAGDKRVRKDHQILDGKSVPMDKPFIAPDGSKLMFPGDRSLGASGEETINCRCRVQYKVDWFADID